MAEKPKILCVCDAEGADLEIPASLHESFDLVTVRSPVRALAKLNSTEYSGIFIASRHLSEAMRYGRMLQNEQILEGMPDGVALLDGENAIIWANQQLRTWSEQEDLVGKNFYAAMKHPEILGPDFCPFHTALATHRCSNSTLRDGDNRYYQIHAAPVLDMDKPSHYLIVTVSDVTSEMLQRQKLEAIHRAGIELADLTPDEVFDMAVEDRIELVKSNILHYTKDLLNFDVIEIRLLDQKSGILAPLLSVGMVDDATCRLLRADPQSNGVTGFVAATGKSYLCEDTGEDPLYLPGLRDAKSSLTVPLMWHEQVIGTFNVESPEIGAFSESDLQFLEIFARDIAVSLNTLELLVAQKANTAQESVEAIHSAVALPIDEILNEAVNVMEMYIGHEPEVVVRLKNILRNARDLKQVIQKVGQRMAPTKAVPSSVKIDERPKLKGRRVLVVDADDEVRNNAHALLERYGCIVETAHVGNEATFMVRNSGNEHCYDVIIADIRLPDMNGHELLLKLKATMNPVPLILMSGFGYDPGHSIVKARREGLQSKAILYKPFRLDQLLETVEAVLDTFGTVPQVTTD